MRLQYRRQGSNDYLFLRLSLWHGLISYKLEVPVVKTGIRRGKKPWNWSLWPRSLRPAFKIEAKVTGKNNPNPVTEIKEEEVLSLQRILSIIKKQIRFLQKYMPVLRYLLGRVNLRRFQWMTEFGMEEPHITGFLVGLAGGIKGMLLSKLYRVLHSGAARPTVVITPKFDKSCFATQIDCEFDVKIGHVFLAGIRIFFKRVKG
jgi:hypothetical protein